ncbi:MAG: lauroyl acyltransferase [Magnetovibrionaceae bacterium]
MTEPTNPHKTKPKHYLEAAIAYPLFWLVGLLPINWASGLGGWLARTIGPGLKVSNVARQNLARAFPEKDADWIEATVKGVWDNLGRTAFEFPGIHKLFSPGDERVEIVGREHFELLRDDGRNGLFFSGHQANWEITPLFSMLNGLPVSVVFRRPNNPLILKLFQSRQLSGQLIPKGAEGARQAIGVLAKGGHVGLVVDQKMNDGIKVPFFGRDAMTAPALARFALKYDCPVVPTRIERLGGARFRVTFSPPMEIKRSGDLQTDMLNLMTEVNLLLESWIRERPSEWFWLHRRWPD